MNPAPPCAPPVTPLTVALPGAVVPPYSNAASLLQVQLQCTGCRLLNSYSLPLNNNSADYYVITASSQRNGTNIDTAAMNNYDGNDAMMDEPPQTPPIIGEILIIQSHLHLIMTRGIYEPHEEFRKQMLTTKEARRIKKAMATNQLDTATSRIAACQC